MLTLYCVSLLVLCIYIFSFFLFFFNDTAPTEIYTLSLQTLFRSRALPNAIQRGRLTWAQRAVSELLGRRIVADGIVGDRKSTRLNSSHRTISYAVFCLKKKNFIPILTLAAKRYRRRPPPRSLHAP